MMGGPAQAVDGVNDPFIFVTDKAKVIDLGQNMKNDGFVNLPGDAAVKVFPTGMVKAVVVGRDADEFLIG